MKWKKMMAAILIAIITVTGTVGCSRITKDTKKEDTKAQDAKEVAEQKTVAMGRYVEQAVKMPEAVTSGDEFAYICKENPMHQLEIYCGAMSGNETMKYTLQPDNSWERTVPEWLQFKDKKVISVTYAADGTRYAIVSEYGEDKVKVHIIKSSDQKTYEEITPTDFKDAVDYIENPNQLEILPDGRLMLIFYNQITIYKDGRADIVIPTSDYRYALSADGTQLMLINEKADGIFIAETETGKTISEIPCQGGLGSIAFTSDESGNWYVLNNKGISRLIKNGSVLETIVDGALSSMSMPSYGMDAICMGENNDFYTMYQLGDGVRDIKHYVYDVTMPSTSEKRLTIISLVEDATTRQAIISFQQKNSNVKVDYRTTYSENSGATVADQIKTINTELLAGKGADLYILDGLPAASYIEKGALADISEVLEPLREKGEILNNIVNCYKSNDAIYMAPTKFVMPIVFGTKDAIKAAGSIWAMADYAKNNARLPLFGEYGKYKTYSGLTTKLFFMYSDEFLNDKLEINKDGLIKFLEALKVICDQTKVNEDTAEVDFIYNDIDEVTLESQMIYDGSSELGLDYIFSESYFYCPVYAVEKINGEYTSINSQFFPVGMIGVNNASTQKELAYEFIKELYSEEVQAADIDQGFPVNVKVLEKLCVKPDKYYFGGPNNFEAGPPSKEKMQELIALTKTLNNPIERDKVLPNVVAVEQNNVLLNMILVEALPYLKGQTDAASTAGKIMNKASTYLAE